MIGIRATGDRHGLIIHFACRESKRLAAGESNSDRHRVCSLRVKSTMRHVRGGTRNMLLYARNRCSLCPIGCLRGEFITRLPTYLPILRKSSASAALQRQFVRRHALLCRIRVFKCRYDDDDCHICTLDQAHCIISRTAYISSRADRLDSADSAGHIPYTLHRYLPSGQQQHLSANG